MQFNACTSLSLALLFVSGLASAETSNFAPLGASEISTKPSSDDPILTPGEEPIVLSRDEVNSRLKSSKIEHMNRQISQADTSDNADEPLDDEFLDSLLADEENTGEAELVEDEKPTQPLPVESEAVELDSQTQVLQRGEPPYPGSEGQNEEFASAKKQQTKPKLSWGTIIVEDENGNESEVAHPLANKGLVRITKEGLYLYDSDIDPNNTPSVSPKMTEAGLEGVDESGAYIYDTSKKSPDPDSTSHKWHDKGLLAIEDKTYLYQTTASPREGSYSIKAIGGTSPSISRQVNGSVIDYERIYGSSVIGGVLLERDFRLFRLESLRTSLSTGLFYAQGRGVFEDSPDTDAEETYTLIALPTALTLTYRAQFADSQWFVPYFGGGGGGTFAAETRDDGKRNVYMAIPMVTGYGGLAINMKIFDRNRVIQLDMTQGINELWLTLEARLIQSLNADIDFSSQLLVVGFAIDY